MPSPLSTALNTQAGSDVGIQVPMKPKIELKHYSSNARLSEETIAYSADVWIDGVLSFTAANRGSGGSDEYRPIYKDGKSDHEAYDRALSKIKAYCASAAPIMIGAPGHQFEHHINVEDFVQEAVFAFEEAKDKKRETTKIQKKMLTNVYVLYPADKSVRTFTFRSGPVGEAHFRALEVKHPTLKVLNREGAEVIFKHILAFQTASK